MTVKSGQAWYGLFVCKDATGALSTPSVGPAGALYVDGTVNAASVTISGSNPYKFAVTLPALTAGQCVSMYITATIATIATASVVAENVADTVRLSDVPAVNVTYSAGVALSGRLAEAADLPSEPLDATATQAAAAAALTAYDPPTKTEMDAGFTALNDLDAAGIRLAVGLATANLDMQLSTIDGIVDDLALVAPDNKPIVNVDGETLAYMTALSEEEIAAAVVVALQETPVEVICITPQPSQESDYDILRNNATNC